MGKNSIEKQYDSRQLERFLSSLNSGLCLIDSERKISWINEGYKKIFEGENCIGELCHQFYEQPSDKCLRCRNTRITDNEELVVSEIHLPQKGKWLKITCQPLEDASGKSANILQAVTDITEQKRSEMELQTIQQHAKSLMESATGFLVYRLVSDEREPHKLRLVFISPSAEEILGLPHPIEFESFFHHAHPDDIERIELANRKAFITNRFDEEYRFYNEKLKQWRWIHAISTGGKDEHGWNHYVNGIMIDVTEKHQLGEKLLESQEHLDSLMESASGFVVYRMVYAEGQPYNLKMSAISPSVKDILGIDPEDFAVTSYYDSIHPDDMEGVMKAHVNAFETGRYEQIARVYNPDIDEYKWIHAISIAVRNDQGMITHVNGLLIDVTEKQNAIHALRKREENLQIQTNKLKEMNTALNVLIDKREADRLELEQSILMNIDEMILPDIDALKNSHLPERLKFRLDSIENNLGKLTSRFSLKLSMENVGLTPAELRVASHIKEGKSTKTIASMLNVSPKTIKNHRIKPGFDSHRLTTIRIRIDINKIQNEPNLA